MGEAKRKSRSRAEILSGEMRCVYCTAKPDSVEHMPPRAIFGPGMRPSGLEFASCEACNFASRASDTAAAYLALIAPNHVVDKGELERAQKLLSTLARHAPRFIVEVFDPAKRELVWAKGRSNVFGQMRRLTLDGPVTTALVQAFGAKLGMALYREHVGIPLPVEGKVFVQHYFNAGLYREEVETTLSILPMFGQLSQGRKQSGRVFNYRFNTDEKEILGAFCAFNDNLFFRIFAISNPIYFSLLKEMCGHRSIGVGDLQVLSKAWVPGNEKGQREVLLG